MDNRVEIVKATYGIGQENDADIRHLFAKELRLSKLVDLHKILETDPYPNQKKFVQVVFQNTNESTQILHEECLKIKEGGTRIGFEGTSFSIDIPRMYSFRVLESTFSIRSIHVRCFNNPSAREAEVPPARWKHIVNRSPKGFYTIQDVVRVEDLTDSGDPFPGEKKVIYISYSQTATYEVTVYEIGGKLVKDVVLVELPKYPCTMLYHLYPKFDHPVMNIHKKYLRICGDVFQKIVVSIAHDRMGSSANEITFRSILRKDPNASIDFLHTINNQHRGEAMSFMNLLNTVSYLNDNHILFYAHSKGLRHYNRNYVESISKWVEHMYIQCLMNIDTMIYTRANCGGNFRKTCMIDNHHNPKWHYSGSFYLMKSSLLNRKFIIQRYAHDYFISERCPGLMCPHGDKCLEFLSLRPGFDNLYDNKSSNIYNMYIP